MKTLLSSAIIVAVLHTASFAQAPAVQIEGKEVVKNDDVVFRQIDEHTWIGSGHLMASESLYLVEGNDKAVLIDAGTTITDLDKIVASLTKKPVILVVTHAHPDHTGSAINYFPDTGSRTSTRVTSSARTPKPSSASTTWPPSARTC